MSLYSSQQKFNHGEAVIIKENAPSYLHPGEICSICSILKIDLEDVKKNSSLIEPTWLYTVEFGDGSSIELSEFFLEKYQQN